MREVSAPKAIKTWRIICAAQSEPNYSESRQILIYGGENSCEDKYILLDGGHCSCYGWPEVEWDAVEYTKDELLTLAESKKDGAGCYYDSEKAFWQCVLIALGGE